MSVPQPIRSYSNHIPAPEQLKHFRDTENLGLFGQVKVAFVPAGVICQINVVPKFEVKF